MKSGLQGKKIVIGITGSIAAFKIPFLIRLLVKEKAEIQVIMTPSAHHFVTPLTLSTLSVHEVITEPFDPKTGQWNSHVDLGTWADLMLFAPVSANTLGKFAHGIADNFLTTVYLSAKCPVFIAPAMDLDMYKHPSTSDNIRILSSFGNHIIEPQVGELASGLSGAGRMEEPENILHILSSFLKKKNDLGGKRVLITAGPTYEAIDPVRYIGNHSSGRMGYALAEECAFRGGEVTLISGPSNLLVSSPSVHRIDIVNADEMRLRCLEYSEFSDIIIMAAAIADFTPEKVAKQKIKKGLNPNDLFSLKLKSTVDVLAEMGKRKKKGQLLVGFALETEKELVHAREKMKNKNLDFIVLNSLRDEGSGFGHNTNKVTIIGKSGKPSLFPLKQKTCVAADIVDYLLQFLR